MYTHRLQFSALDLLSIEIINIGCHRLGQQLEETWLLCRLLFGVLGSEKWFQSDSAAGQVPIEVCRSGLNLATLLLHCHTLLTFSGLCGFMTGWCGKYHCSLFWVSLSSVWSISERIQRYHPCQWFPDSAFVISRLSVGATRGTWVAPLQSRSCSVTSLRPLATEFLLHIFHRCIVLFVPTFWLLVVPLSNDRWHRSLNRRIRHATIYSTGLLVCHLQLMLLLWQELLLASLVGFHLRPNQSMILLPIMQFCLPTSWTQKVDECCNNLVQESLEPRLNCSSDLASSSKVGSGLSALAAPQSGHPISLFRVRRIALLSIAETSHGLTQLSALFQSLHPVIHGSLLLIEMLCGLGVGVLTPLICPQMRLRIPNHTLQVLLGLSLCLSAGFAPLGVLLGWC